MQYISKVSLLIFLYYVTYYLYIGLLQPIPALGDSYDYHIPISQSILSGTFLHLGHAKPQWYYPGSAEAINSVLLLLHIPLTISNLIAIVALFFACYKLAKTFKLEFWYTLLFAATICTLTAVVRWMNAVSIDVWLAVFFVVAIALLEQPKKSWTYFAKLGFFFGMLVGSKYTGCFFALVLIVLYAKTIKQYLTFKRLIAFFIPFALFGVSWYVRNYLLTKDPFYPLSVFGFVGVPLFSDTIVTVMLHHPLQMLNAAFGEYKLWLLPIPIALLLLLQKLTKHETKFTPMQKLYVLGLINFLIFFTFPTSNQEWIMVSSFRYSFPAFIPLILGTFLLAAKYKKEELLGIIAIANMLDVLSMTYYPKLLLLYVPLSLIIFYWLDKRSSKIEKKQKMNN